jgi:hypothetical protein
MQPARGTYLVKAYLHGLESTYPGREKNVSIWETETLILRLTAVVFVFALLRISRRRKETGRETVLYLFVVAASATVNLLRAGGGGFFMTLAGAAAALAISAPLLAKEKITLRDAAGPAAAGSLLGPIGGLAAIAIAAVIYAIDRSTGPKPAPGDMLAPLPPAGSAGPAPKGSSVLAILESRRIRNRGSLPGDDPAAAPVPRAAGLIPWSTSLALATLAVLMTDLFV